VLLFVTFVSQFILAKMLEAMLKSGDYKDKDNELANKL
jgi:hypothetical protein